MHLFIFFFQENEAKCKRNDTLYWTAAPAAIVNISFSLVNFSLGFELPDPWRGEGRREKGDNVNLGADYFFVTFFLFKHNSYHGNFTLVDTLPSREVDKLQNNDN